MIKGAWADILNQLPRPQAALLEESEPVAASSSAFVLKFKYDIHCQMAADNQELISNFGQYMAGITGNFYEIVFVPEQNWLKIRTEFIQHHKMEKKTDEEDTGGEQVSEVVQSILVEEQQASEDPLVSEAEKLFGKDFVEIEE